jgi:transcriptional regulator with XRE-family HTH domain
MERERQALAAYIKELRRGRGYSQESLAERANVSKRTVERLERAEGDVTVLLFARVVGALGASPGEALMLAERGSFSPEEARTMARARLDRGTTGSSSSDDPATLQAINALRHLTMDQLLHVLETLVTLLREQNLQWPTNTSRADV